MRIETKREIKTPLFFIGANGLIEKEGKYLVSRRSQLNNYMPLKWDIPGGEVEFGETTEQALVREIDEETRLKVIVGKVQHIFSSINEGTGKQHFQVIYLCKYMSGEVKLNPEEHDKFEWVSKEEIKDRDMIAFLEDFINSSTFKEL